VSKQKLDLAQLTTGKMAEPRAATPKIMRREFFNSGTRRGGSDDLPEYLGRHACSPDPTRFIDRSKERAFGDATGFLPFIDCSLHPCWDWDGTDVPSFAQEVGDNPMLLARLDGVNPKAKQLAAAQSASDQHRDHGVIPLAPQRNPIGDCEQSFRLFSCQPVSDANSDPAYALDSSDSGSEFRTEKAGIGSFKRDTSDSSQTEIDGCRCILLLLEKDPVSQNHCTVECEARF